MDLGYEVIYFWQIVLALILGLVVGTERTVARKTAGMRTYALVSMASCVLIIISRVVMSQYVMFSFDPLRLAAGIVMGIGFLGTGVILHNEGSTSGLTTAAGIWVSAAIGISIGFGMYAIAIVTALLTILTFTVFWFVEDKVRDVSGKVRDQIN
jgi:putative Mg2+ transporter-C (MgtC) family protein